MTALLDDGTLNMAAASVDDLEAARCAAANRFRSLTNNDPDADGYIRGFGLGSDVAAVAAQSALVDALVAIEKDAIKALQKSVRKHPLWDGYGKDIKGLGEKQFARLLAKIGDPYWNTLHDRPRTVSELWAYCGLHVVNGSAPRRQRGQQSNWSEDARKRVWLISASCIKSQGDIVHHYYNTKEHYQDAAHNTDCVRCGTKGKPAAAGTPLKPAHIHARAMRALSKEILRGLWVAARDYHAALAAPAPVTADDFGLVR